MERPPVRYTTTPDGVNLAYQIVGNGPLDILFFGSWFGQIDSRWEWPGYRRWLERLGGIGRLMVFDKRGVGASDPAPPNSLSLESWSEDGLAVMDAVGSERAAVVAWTDASPMALLFAAAHPDRVHALAIVNWIGRIHHNARRPWVWGSDALEFLPQLAPSEAANPAYADWFLRMQRAASGPGAARAMQQINVATNVYDVMPTVHVPTLFLQREGVASVELGEEQATRVPGAKFVTVPGNDLHSWTGDVDVLVDEVEAFFTGTRPAPVPERALLALLFTDVVGSTAKAAELGDGEWRRVLASHNEALRAVVRAHNGREVFVKGDEFLIVFDGPARATRCAQAIHAEAAHLGLEMRSGLHMGEVELHSNDVAGIAVHIAARIRELANPGDVLVSRTIKDLVAGSGLEFADRGAHQLKGVPEEWHVYAVA